MDCHIESPYTVSHSYTHAKAYVTLYTASSVLISLKSVLSNRCLVIRSTQLYTVMFGHNASALSCKAVDTTVREGFQNCVVFVMFA